MSSDIFFTPRPQRAFPHEKRATGHVLQDSTLFSPRSSTKLFPKTPLAGPKTPFGFKSPTPVLFASPSSRRQLSYSSPPSTPLKGKGNAPLTRPLPTRSDLGYLAFPTGSPTKNPTGVTDTLKGSFSIHTPTKPKGTLDPNSARTPPCTPPTSNGSNSARISPSRVLEQAEAERGEEEWVSRGGMLRDRFGNVDVARTKKVREEVERKVREKVLKERWEGYEERWRRLVERCGGPGSKGKYKARDDEQDIGFNDIPWPVWVEDRKEEKPRFSMSINRSLQPSSASKNTHIYTLQDLTIDQIEDFLISPLSIRGCTETPKYRVRRSYLRWHPDKLGWLVDKVKDEDVEDVKAGVGTVLECLRRMNTKFRAQGGPADSSSSSSTAGPFPPAD